MADREMRDLLETIASLERRTRRALPAGSVHALGAGGDGAPLGRGAAAGRGPAVPRGRAADGRVDDDGDAGRALAAPRRGRLPLGAGPPRPPEHRRPRQGPAARAVVAPARGRGASAPSSPASGRSRSRAATRRSTCCSCARPTSPSTCRTASSTAASPGSTSCASAAPTSRCCWSSASARARSRPRCRRSRRRSRSPSSPGCASRPCTRTSRALLAERGIEVELIEITGSVEVAPRLGLADAIVDLVSSGNTLRTNGLRSLGSLLSSQAVLVGAARATAARGSWRRCSAPWSTRARTRYLMLNAPAALPASASSSPAALAERAAAGRGGHGRRARTRPGRRRLAPAAASSRRPARLDPAPPRGADARMTIVVRDQGARGRGRARVGARLDGAEPARAGPRRRGAREAVLALAAGPPLARGAAAGRLRSRSRRASSSSAAGCRSTRSASTSRAGSSRRSSCAPCPRRTRASSASSSARRRRAPGPSRPRRACSGSTTSGRSAARRRSAGSPTSSASRRSSAPAARP